MNFFKNHTTIQVYSYENHWLDCRIGLTGRAGKERVAITFVTPREIDHLRRVFQAYLAKKKKMSV
ncbi:hypothetical protein DNHGIG_32870 [Collibacillus ludicampi]|uniref:Uncharacterized protein n=1 Tax=Collibacillus ludicampi TaxID=2771369 RepID=A0AAV4LIY8_9BACL|nr:hypothetical protein [Collibacillus ludicampi]GIM47738.1 hypothetical protein DNHGIG_32870 [Collibacillus ludicampi]